MVGAREIGVALLSWNDDDNESKSFFLSSLQRAGVQCSQTS